MKPSETIMISTKQVDFWQKELKRLKEQIEEANTVILSLPTEKISTCMIAFDYLKKWGVK